MKILFDHQIFSYERFGGISRYFSQLINHCRRHPDWDADLSLKFSDNIYLKMIGNIDVKPLFNNTYFKKKPGILNALNFPYSVQQVRNQKFDVFHPTFYNPYFLKHIGDKPFVLTVHDMITEIFPDMFPGQKKISAWKMKLITKAHKIITVSERSKKDIIRLCGIREKDIHIIHHGSFLKPGVVKDTPPFDLPQKYLLFVGKRSFYKNFIQFVSAAAPLLHKDDGLHMVCTGGVPFTPDEKRLFNKLTIHKHVHRYIIDDRLMPVVYQNALALAIPSLYEGFGMPVIEAFSCGCPVISSDKGSLKEVGGNAAFYFNPTDASEIRSAIETVINDSSLREELRQKGFERIKHFSWDTTAKKTIDVYERVAPLRRVLPKTSFRVKILYDHQVFSYERYGGISRYFSQLMKHYRQSPACAVDLSLKFSDNIYLENTVDINVIPLLKNVYFKKKPGLLNRMNIYFSRQALARNNFDIFHPTFYNPYFLDHIGDKPFVLSVHDMITELFPDMFSRQDMISEWKTTLIQKADRIITSSENTRQDIVRLCGIHENKVDVVYLGSSLHDDVPKNSAIPRLPENYLLYVGKRPFYKNFDRFIRAVSYLLVMDKKLHLICAGSTRFSNEEIKRFKALDVSEKVFHYPVDDHLLAALYRNALAFVFPSLYEGFGIPVVEAFSCGCPAIISKTSSLPEVGGKAVIYFDPEDEASIQEAVKKVIYDKSLRNILRQEGIERIRKFTWEQTALNTLNIYKKVSG